MIKNSNLYIILSTIFVTNIVFKLIYISSPSLWYDEIISAKDTLLDFGHIKHEAEWDKNPPFYHYVLWIWSKLFGISEMGLRSMSAFFSSVTAVLIYWFSLKISNKCKATIVTILFTFHPFLYYYAQEARCFSFLIFLTTLNLILVYYLVQSPNYLKAFLLGVLNFLIFYTHYLAGLILLCQFIYLLIVFRKKLLYIPFIYLTPVLLVLIRFTSKQYKVLFFSQEMSKEKSNVPLAELGNLATALSKLYSSNYVFILFVLFIFYFLIRVIRQKISALNKDVQFKIFLISSPILCIIILYLLGTWTNVFHERYLIFIMPYIILSPLVFTESKVSFYSFATVLLIFEIINLSFKQSRKMDYRFCAILTKEIQKKQEVNILIQTHDVVNLYTYYYDMNTFKSKSRMSKEYLALKKIYYFDNFDDFKKISFDKSKPILLFQTYQKPNDSYEIMRYFKEQKYYIFTTSQIEGVKFSFLTN